MKRKKLPNDIDFAAGFFSNSTTKETASEKITAPAKIITEQSKSKNLGGRPKKTGLKNHQFTLTMNPEKYEKLRIVAKEYTNGNFSALIDEAIEVFCKKNKINLSSIEVDNKIMEVYRQKQDKKSRSK